MYKASFKFLDRSTLQIEGYMLAWGDPFDTDQTGDYFDREQSDLWLQHVERIPVLWEHGMGDDSIGKTILGYVNREDITFDDFGAKVRATLNVAGDYMRAIAGMLREGRLGFSTGSVGHLVERMRDGLLRSWPVVELSLTQSPAEKKLIGVSLAGQLGKSEMFPALGIFAEVKSIDEAIRRIDQRDELMYQIEKMELSREIGLMEVAEEIAALERSL